jgi:hypothetical protein
MQKPSADSSPLSNLQRQMLELFAKDVPEKDLLAIKHLIGRYFAEKAMDLADEAWENKGLTDKDVERLLNTKMRTPYKSKKE